jgi:lipopolysaccharide export system protein LptA
MGKGAAKGEIGVTGNQQISRMEAQGSVRVTQNEQRAQGDRAEFDMQKNLIALKGKVVVARGDDMLAGEALYVDLTNGVSRMESGGGRVQGMFKPSTETEKSEKPVPTNLKGLATQNRGELVKISAARLEVRDKEKRATFSGNVHVIQGETEMRSDALVIFYDTEAGKGAGNAKQQQLRRMEAKGSVKVIQKDQRAHGDSAEFDMRKNTAVLKGNVVLARGPDVVVGKTLYIDLTSGLAQIDSGGRPVEAVFKASPGQQPKIPGKQN